MTIVAIGAAAVAVILMAVQMKSIRGEYAVYMVMAAGCFIFFYGTGKLAVILDTLRQIQSYINIDNVYLGTLLKMIGITYVAEFASGLCRDAGYASVGAQIEMFGKFSIMAVSMPILLALIETIEGFLT